MMQRHSSPGAREKDVKAKATDLIPRVIAGHIRHLFDPVPRSSAATTSGRKPENPGRHEGCG